MYKPQKKSQYWLIGIIIILVLILGNQIWARYYLNSPKKSPKAAPPVSSIQKKAKKASPKPSPSAQPSPTASPDQAAKKPEPPKAPSPYITRAELAQLLVETLGYPLASEESRFSDTTGLTTNPYINTIVDKQIMKAYDDGNFQPDLIINRAQLVLYLVRSLNFDQKSLALPPEWPSSFVDIKPQDWFFSYVELAKQFELLPSNYETSFEPQKAVTKTEAQKSVAALKKLEIIQGKISNIDSNSGLITITTNETDAKLGIVSLETLIYRNNNPASLEGLLKEDTIAAISSAGGEIKYLIAKGKLSQNDLLSKISSLTKEKLTTADIKAIIAGDWNQIKVRLKTELFNRLIDYGLTPMEAESLIAQDWNYLDNLSQTRVASVLAGYSGLSEEFCQILLARDWEKIKEYGTLELATVALGHLLGN